MCVRGRAVYRYVDPSIGDLSHLDRVGDGMDGLDLNLKLTVTHGTQQLVAVIECI